MESRQDKFVMLLFTGSAVCASRTAYYRSLAYTRLEMHNRSSGRKKVTTIKLDTMLEKRK